MTSKEYVERSGHDCPACLAKDSVRFEGRINAIPAEATAMCRCSICGAMWRERYKLVGFDNLAPGENDVPESPDTE